ADRARIRSTYGIAENATVFLFCGKLIPAKRPRDLVEAVGLLPEGLPHIHLVFAGDGPLRPDLAAHARALGLVNVTLAGFRNQNERPDLYAAADALVLPSVFEPWGLVINEALNFGLYVVASDRVGAGPDLLADPRLGTRYTAGDPAALAAAMAAFAGQAAANDRSTIAADVLARWSLTASADGIISAMRSTRVPQHLAACTASQPASPCSTPALDPCAVFAPRLRRGLRSLRRPSLFGRRDGLGCSRHLVRRDSARGGCGAAAQRALAARPGRRHRGVLRAQVRCRFDRRQVLGELSMAVQPGHEHGIRTMGYSDVSPVCLSVVHRRGSGTLNWFVTASSSSDEDRSSALLA